MTEYKFNMEKLREIYGTLCPCLVPSKETAVIENMCPCREFIKNGICRCKIFEKIE